MDFIVSNTRQILTGRNDLIHVQFFRYIVTGVLAVILDVSILWICAEVFGIYYLISATLAFICGLGLTYTLSIIWIFPVRTAPTITHEIVVFAGIGAIGLIINGGVMWLLTDIFALYYLYSKFFSIILLILWNFMSRKYLLFYSKVPIEIHHK